MRLGLRDSLAACSVTPSRNATQWPAPCSKHHPASLGATWISAPFQCPLASLRALPRRFQARPRSEWVDIEFKVPGWGGEGHFTGLFQVRHVPSDVAAPSSWNSRDTLFRSGLGAAAFQAHGSAPNLMPNKPLEPGSFRVPGLYSGCHRASIRVGHLPGCQYRSRLRSSTIASCVRA